MEHLIPVTNHRTYVIALSNSERVQQTVRQLLRHTPHVRLWKAIRGADLRPEQLETLLTPRALRTICGARTRTSNEDLETVGAVGCYLSHLTLWMKQVELQWPYMVVFEDDIELCHDFEARFAETWQQLMQYDVHFDALMLENMNRLDPSAPTVQPGIPLFRCRDRFMGTAGYVLRQSGARKLLEHALPMDVQVDAYMGLRCGPHWSDPLRLYFTQQPLGRQKPGAWASTQVQNMNVLNVNPKVLVPDTAEGQSKLLVLFVAVCIIVYYLGFRRAQRRKQ